MEICIGKKAIFFVWLWLLATLASASQSDFLDSLRNDFDSGGIKQKIKAANELAWQLRYANMDSALYYAQWAYDQSLEIKDERLNVTALKRMGVILKNKGNFSEALEKMQAVLEHEKLFENTKGIAGVYNNMGTVYKKIGSLDEAYKCYIASLRIKEQYYPNSHTLCNTYRNLANFYGDHREDTDTALYYLDKAEMIASELNEKRALANIENDRGKIYQLKGELGRARKHLYQSLSAFREIDDEYGQGLLLSNLGLLLIKLKKFNQAGIHLYESLDIWKANKDSVWMARVNNSLGYLMLQQDKFEMAKGFYESAYDIANRLKDAESIKYACFGMAESNAGIGNYKDAYEFLKVYDTIEDSLYSSRKDETISLLRERFNTEKREKEIVYLNTIRNQQASALSQSETIRQRTMVVSVLVVIIIGMLAVYYREKQKGERREALRKDELNTLKMKALHQQKEMQVMEATIFGQEEERQRISSMLHGEVGGVLHTIKMYFSSWEEKVFDKMDVERNQYEKASELLDRATEEIREVSHSLDAGIVNNLGLATALEEMANGINRTGKMEVTLDMHNIDREGLTNKKEIGIYRIIQEAVGNVLRHSGASKVDISLTRGKSELTIIIEDNGKGFELVEARKKGGLGLRNIEDRVTQLGGDVVFDAMPGRGVAIIININV